MQYLVDYNEVWVRTMVIEADSVDDAIQRAYEEDGEEVSLEYGHVMQGDEIVTIRGSGN